MLSPSLNTVHPSCHRSHLLGWQTVSQDYKMLFIEARENTCVNKRETGSAGEGR